MEGSKGKERKKKISLTHPAGTCDARARLGAFAHANEQHLFWWSPLLEKKPSLIATQNFLFSPPHKHWNLQKPTKIPYWGCSCF